jgi:hypothetical protein
MGCKHCINTSGAQVHISMHKHESTFADNKSVCKTAHLSHMINHSNQRNTQDEKYPKQYSQKSRILFCQQLIVNWPTETLPAGFIWCTQLLRNLLHRKIHFFSKFLKPLLLYYSPCKIKMLETVIAFNLQAPHVSCTYHTRVVRYVNLPLSPVLGRMKMVLEAISRNGICNMYVDGMPLAGFIHPPKRPNLEP